MSAFNYSIVSLTSKEESNLTTSAISPPGSAPKIEEEIEEGLAFAPRFDAAGLLTCVITDARSGELLMVAHMNVEALARTVRSGEVWLYSRSRSALWKKGETSGHVLTVIEMRVDCDQDVLWLKVEQAGAGACHTGRRSCFYRAVVQAGPGAPLMLEFRDGERVFDPAAVYGAPASGPDKPE